MSKHPSERSDLHTFDTMRRNDQGNLNLYKYYKLMQQWKKIFIPLYTVSIFIFSEKSWYKNISTLHIRAVDVQKRFCNTESNIVPKSK